MWEAVWCGLANQFRLSSWELSPTFLSFREAAMFTTKIIKSFHTYCSNKKEEKIFKEVQEGGWEIQGAQPHRGWRIYNPSQLSILSRIHWLGYVKSLCWWLYLYLYTHTHSNTKVLYLYRWPPIHNEWFTYDFLTYDFSILLWCESNMHSVGTVFQILNLDLFWASSMRCDISISHDAGQL